MIILFSAILGLIIGAVSIYFVMRPKMKAAQELDQEIIKKNNEMNERWESISKEVEILTARRDEVNEGLEKMLSTHQKTANTVYETCMSGMQEKLAVSAQKLSEEYQKTQEQAKNEYLEMLVDAVADFNDAIATKQVELSTISTQLAEMQAITNAAVEANRRAQEMKEHQNFYRLVLSDVDLLEIERLREVAPFLRDSEPLNKVIWKVYYENPYTDLIGRVVGKQVKTGIYKITNLHNGMCYVGQAVNIADRWRQHIKRGLGAETPTRNKLYPAMLAIGVENFSFEIVEECERSKLNEREDYWQEYFQAKEFGYSIK
jgi:hypothetical protein